jgi:uncharacterized protein (TIGR00255 family)
MISMTGHGYAEAICPARQISVEIRSVNNRYLDITVSLPSFLNSLESQIRSEVGGIAGRGKVDVVVRLREFEVPIEIHVDRAAVTAAVEALRTVGETAAISEPPAIRDVISLEGVIHTERKREPEQYRDQIMDVLNEAKEQWHRQRIAEGAATKADIERQMQRIEAVVPVFEAAAEENESLIFASVRERFREVLGEQAEEQRIYQEAAALIVKHNTNEECVRLRSHIQLFRETVDRGGTIGKKLDFVCQELNREVNTIAGKALVGGMQRAVVEAKDAIEAIREQIRNVG